MLAKMKLIPCLVVGLALSLGYNVYLLETRPVPKVPGLLEDEQRLVDRAVMMAARRDGVPPNDTLRLSSPVLVHFKYETCVELQPKWGVVGGMRVRCFDRKTGALTRQEEVGQ